jgi:hypothetical protein
MNLKKLIPTVAVLAAVAAVTASSTSAAASEAALLKAGVQKGASDDVDA